VSPTASLCCSTWRRCSPTAPMRLNVSSGSWTGGWTANALLCLPIRNGRPPHRWWVPRPGLADLIEDAVRGRAVDGVTLIPLALPSGLRAITDGLLPLLGERGLWSDGDDGDGGVGGVGRPLRIGRQSKAAAEHPVAEHPVAEHPATLRDRFGLPRPANYFATNYAATNCGGYETMRLRNFIRGEPLHRRPGHSRPRKKAGPPGRALPRGEQTRRCGATRRPAARSTSPRSCTSRNTAERGLFDFCSWRRGCGCVSTGAGSTIWTWSAGRTPSPWLNALAAVTTHLGLAAATIKHHLQRAVSRSPSSSRRWTTVRRPGRVEPG